jgi:hypothetical protein
MFFFAIILQIGELFKGTVNRDGIIALFLFILMGAIVVGFGGFIIYKAFKPKDK